MNQSLNISHKNSGQGSSTSINGGRRKSRVMVNGSIGGNEKRDELDDIIKKSVIEMSDAAQVSKRILATVENTQQIAVESLSTLGQQGEKINHISGQMDDLGSKIHSANRDVKYLSKLTGNIFIPVFPRFDYSVVSKLEFASNAPKDATTGRPIATPRGTSLNIAANGNVLSSTRGVTNTQVPELRLDDSASEKDRLAFQKAQKDMDENLEMVSKGVGNLRNVAVSMGSELERQTKVVQDLDLKADKSVIGIAKLNSNIKEIMRKS